MAVLNFPANPASQTPTNVYSPTSSPAKTTNGVTYVFADSKWKATAPGSGGGGGDTDDIRYEYPGGVEQTLQNRLEQAIYVSDFGAVGDGTADDTAAIQAAIDAATASGVALEFTDSAYAISSIDITCPSVKTNGCQFNQLDNGNASSAAIKISGTLPQIIDNIALNTKAANTQRRAISIDGTSTTIGYIEVVCDAQNTGSQLDYAVGIAGSYITISHLWVENYDKACRLRGSSDGFITINRLDIINYLQGVSIQNGQNILISNTYMRGRPAGTTWKNGYNGFLISGDTEDYGIRNVTISNFTIEDSWEHAIRVSGDYAQRNLTFDNFRIQNCGGCGIKVLSYTDSGLRHRNIIVKNGEMLDLGEPSVEKLKAGVMYYNTVECTVSNVFISSTDGGPESCEVGISLFNALDTYIDNVSVKTAKEGAIQLRSEVIDGDGNLFANACNDVIVNGLRAEQCGYGINIPLKKGIKHKRLQFTGSQFLNNLNQEIAITDARADDDTAGISIQDFYFQGQVINSTLDAANIVLVDDGIGFTKFLKFATVGSEWSNTNIGSGSTQLNDFGLLIAKANVWYNLLDLIP